MPGSSDPTSPVLVPVPDQMPVSDPALEPAPDQISPEPKTSKEEESSFGFKSANAAQAGLSSSPLLLSTVEILSSIFHIVNPAILWASGLGVFIFSARIMYILNEPDPMLKARLAALKRQIEDIESNSQYQPRTWEEIQEAFPMLIPETDKNGWSRFRRKCRENKFALSAISSGLSATISVMSLGGEPLPFLTAIGLGVIPAGIAIPLISIAIQWRLENAWRWRKRLSACEK